MKVFISYHRADTKYRKRAENILRSHHLDYYVVPENADFNGWNPEAIRSFLCEQLDACDVLLCLIGKETYSRPHVDREIHTALRGNVENRLGIIGVHLPTRDDNLQNLDLNTVPTKLWENKNYVIWTTWAELNSDISDLVQTALTRSNDARIQTKHKNVCMELRQKKYYDN